jgi:hypothetical protein
MSQPSVRGSRMIRITVILIAAVLALLGPAALAAAQPPSVPESPSRMRLDVETLTPRMITASTPSVTVTGRVSNTGDRRITDIRVQLQRGEALKSEDELREGRSQQSEPVARSPFVVVSDALEPGQSAPVTLTVPVRGSEGSLRIDDPGVYPLLVNINGQPDYSGRARLAAESLLLPALSVPDAGAAAPSVPAGGPTPVTVLWPLIDDYPRQVQAADGRPALTDDGLAESLAPGGRLFGLLNTVADATADDPALLSALCVAVDPDLLETVRLMAAGYRVRTGATFVPGKGAAAANAWLDTLRTVTSGQCVIAVPYADADLVALSRVGAADLERLALGSASVVAETLKPTAPLAGVLWPAGGAIDQRTLQDAAAGTPTTVLADPARLRNRQGEQPYVVGEPNAGVRALPIDTLVSSFLDGGPTGTGPTAASTDLQRRLAVQNGVSALTYRVAFAAGGSPVLIAPPRRWAAPAGELAVFLTALRDVIEAGFAEPGRLPRAVSAAPQGNAAGWTYTGDDRGDEITSTATAEVVRINAAQRDLQDAMDIDDTAQVNPEILIAPLHYGLLRASSTAWRGRPDQAEAAAGEVAAQLTALRNQVTVSNSGRSFTLASGKSPIPVVLSNTMPVAINVRVRLAETPGLRPEPPSDVRIPAYGAITRYLATEVTRSGRFTVDVSLATPGGTQLGSSARYELTSTVYGKVTLIVTITAAVALFLLAGLRTFRRIRAARIARDGAG